MIITSILIGWIFISVCLIIGVIYNTKKSTKIMEEKIRELHELKRLYLILKIQQIKNHRLEKKD